MPRIRRGGQRIRGSDGGRSREENCCCCDCNAPGGSPTAAFSYEQTGDDPCELNLFDESTEGNCGTITSWRWLKNGAEISTSQNPTGVSYADGDDITLEVTDSAGCTDSAVMEVRCYEYCCGCALPDEMTLTFSGCTFPTSDPTRRCFCTAGVNTINADLTGGVSDCERVFAETGDPALGGNAHVYDGPSCGNGVGAYVDHSGFLTVTCAGGTRTIELYWRTAFFTPSNYYMVYKTTESTSDPCDGSWDLPWDRAVNGANTPYCSSLCTAHITW